MTVSFAVFLAALLAAALAIPNVVLLVEIAAAALLRRRAGAVPSARRPPLAVLVPAHDEEAGVAPTIASVRAQLAPGDRLLVVADNCSDATADIARDAGAEVLVREDRDRRGKGHALQAGLDHLVRTGTADDHVLVVVDADCRLGPGCLTRLAGETVASGRPAQALYRLEATGSDTVTARLSAFAWVVRNHVRPRGLARLGFPCQLMGTGMAMPVACARRVDTGTGHVTEDLVLGAELASAGHPPRFCEDAEVVSAAAASDHDREVQRRRWIHGHLAAIGLAPRLLRAGVLRRDAAVVALGADLLVPPLTLLLAADVALLVLFGVWGVAAGAPALVALGATPLALAGVALTLAWIGHGRGLIGAGDLVRLPTYLAMVVRIARSFVLGRRSGWTRTARVDDRRP